MTCWCSPRRLTANEKLKIFRGTSEEPLHRPPYFPVVDLESIEIRPTDILLLAAPYRTLSDDVSLIRHKINYSQSASFIRNGRDFLLYFLTILQDSFI